MSAISPSCRYIILTLWLISSSYHWSPHQTALSAGYMSQDLNFVTWLSWHPSGVTAYFDGLILIVNWHLFLRPDRHYPFWTLWLDWVGHVAQPHYMDSYRLLIIMFLYILTNIVRSSFTNTIVCNLDWSSRGKDSDISWGVLLQCRCGGRSSSLCVCWRLKCWVTMRSQWGHGEVTLGSWWGHAGVAMMS